MPAIPGIVVNDETLPTTGDLEALGLTNGWVRCLVRDVGAFDQRLQELAWPSSVKLCALLEGQTSGVGGNFEGWETAIHDFATRFRGRVAAVECANELDIWQLQPPAPHQPNPILTPEFAGDLVRTASGPLRDAGMTVIAPAVASEDWVNYLGRMSQRIGDAADLQGFHPYGKKIDGFPAHDHWQELREAIGLAKELAGRPLALTEIGVKLDEVGGREGQRTYMERLLGLMGQDDVGVDFFCYFAWKDKIGIAREGDFGVCDEDGTPRGAALALQAGSLGGSRGGGFG
jgi:hypothetical protein